MDNIVRYLVVIVCIILNCKGGNFREQSDELLEMLKDTAENDDGFTPSRRLLDLQEVENILGVPSMPNHLPEAEPILPGHTLLRPALGMLKSSIKFPHKDLENGAGVYGNVNTIGLKYGARNERVLYSGFRRSPTDYLLVKPLKTKSRKPKFILSSVVLDLDKDKNVYNQLARNIKKYGRAGNESPKRILKIYEESKDIHGHPRPPLGGTKQQKEYPTIKLHVYGKNASPKKSLRYGVNKPLRQHYDNDDLSIDEEVVVKDSFENFTQDFSKSDESDMNPKNKLFWNSKNLFNHIKIHQDAPDYAEFMPLNLSNKIRNWWFYHQDDYQPFDGNSLH